MLTTKEILLSANEAKKEICALSAEQREKAVCAMADSLIENSQYILEQNALDVAAAEGKNALSILTVSDHLFTGESLDADLRQTSFTDMMQVALNTAVRL